MVDAILTKIRSELTKLGYTVHATRQEKLAYNALVVVIEDVEIEVETSTSYICSSYVLVEWDTTNGDNIPNQIVTMISSLENIVVHSGVSLAPTFTFVTCEVNPLGLLYRVSLTIRYKEVINL